MANDGAAMTATMATAMILVVRVSFPKMMPWIGQSVAIARRIHASAGGDAYAKSDISTDSHFMVSLVGCYEAQVSARIRTFILLFIPSFPSFFLFQPIKSLDKHP